MTNGLDKGSVASGKVVPVEVLGASSFFAVRRGLEFRGELPRSQANTNSVHRRCRSHSCHTLNRQRFWLLFSGFSWTEDIPVI